MRMEISDLLKSDIKGIQIGLTKAIQNHQGLVSKLRDDPSQETDIKQELSAIQKHIIELNDKQKILLKQLRKEIEKYMSNGQLPVYNFNFYKIRPGQLESKKRRRKDLSLAPKTITCRPTQSPPSLSPSPTPSSSSSLSDDSLDYDVSPFMLPVPVPRPRPKLLPNMKETVYLSSVSRRDLRPPKLKKNQKIISDEEVFKDIPMYNDPVPSPPPTDEKDLKARFMTALLLIPRAMLYEIQNRKVERKRRSTATNNPNFVYNNDWEIPVWKRSKTYLSPHKLNKVESTTKKCKADEASEGSAVKTVKTDEEPKPDKPPKLCFDDVKIPPGLVVEKVDGKSRNSTPDSTTANMLCFVCRTSGLLSICKDCTACYHLSCSSPGTTISCPNCKNKRSSPGEGSSEESSKEEFASKCPNVAESYNKLKEYIENHADSDAKALLQERENFKVELVMKNQELYTEKEKLEERAAQLSESLLVQEDSRSELLKEEESLLAKIKIIVDFVEVFQKTTKKAKEPVEEEKTKEEDDDDVVIIEKPDNPASSENSNPSPEETPSQSQNETPCPSPPASPAVSFDPDENSRVSPPKESPPEREDCESPVSLSKESAQEEHSRASSSKSVPIIATEENCDSQASSSKDNANRDIEEDWHTPDQSSKESNIDNNEAINHASPHSSKESVTNHLFELDGDDDDQLTSLSVERSSLESDGVEDDSEYY